MCDADSRLVMVPRNDKGLVTMPLARRLREHLIKELRELRVASLIIWSDLHPIPGRDPQASLPALHKRPARSQRLFAVGTAMMTDSSMIRRSLACASPDHR